MLSVEEALKMVDDLIATLPPFVQGLLVKAETATKVQKNKLVAGVLAVMGLYMIFGYFAAFICNVVGFVLPAYWSMAAIETSDKTDDTKWLTYWVVFAAFSVIDFFADGIFTYFPFYWLVKLIFLAWCFAPISENGSHKIYHRVLRPYFLKKQATIDKALQRASEAVGASLKAD
ncbi:receptor expression-enhancing protein 5-like [Varroa jacobsoni]|uniref:Receptor expression-enhancing protein n=1 Tax=Varroa destructor TaxID=109461 RepID=A0A7M7KP10_VARDE|nr:receptor expression-enhancing protein 5-like [Varroa destructor]XP_022707609.1 receptor expression-enhancing protein 5-like [Varroa jacobsoni]